MDNLVKRHIFNYFIWTTTILFKDGHVYTVKEMSYNLFLLLF